MPLTDVVCRNAKPAEKPKKLTDAMGLYLIVMPNGSKLWRHKYRHLGKEKLASYGSYPEVSLQDARECRAATRKLLTVGIDPTQDARNKKQQQLLAAENNFKAIALKWHAYNLDSWTPQYGADLLRHLERDIFPDLGTLPISQIKPLEILRTLRKIEARGAIDIARRNQRICGQIFRYAVLNGVADNDPTAALRGAIKQGKRNHFAAITAQELPNLVKSLENNEARLFRQTRLATRMLMLTFVRTSELINAKWDEFDFEERMWTIPAARMKMRKDHLVPLSEQVIQILTELQEITGKREYVFASQAKPRKPMSNNTILKALERLGYKGQMTGHGFRALAMSTIKEKLGYRHEVIDRQLAHAPRNKVDRAYDRAQFLEERVVMMQRWADYVEAQTNRESPTVIQFARKIQ